MEQELFHAPVSATAKLASRRSARFRTRVGRPGHCATLFGIGSLLLAAGCSKSGLDRVYVSGKASYQSAPIEIGQIRFVPIEDTRGPITIEQIRDGRYGTQTSGGVPVGTHRVEVLMYDAEEYRNTPRIPGAPAVEQRLPAKYNRESQLTLTVEPGSRAIVHDVVLEE